MPVSLKAHKSTGILYKQNVPTNSETMVKKQRLKQVIGTC